MTLYAIILALAPHLRPATAIAYADAIERQAARRRVDPYLVAAVIQRESQWHARARSKTRDFGLMQLHVDRHTHAAWRGREGELYVAARNIRLGVALLAWWRSWHRRRCGVGASHHWLAHYRFGTIVPAGSHEAKTRRAALALRKFGEGRWW